VRPASAARDRQSQSNLFRPDLFCLSVSICNLSAKIFDSENPQNVIFLVRFADFARTCAVIVNVPDLKAYSSVAAKLLRRVTSYASSEALLCKTKTSKAQSRDLAQRALPNCHFSSAACSDDGGLMMS
jgi:hypothetical protein